MLEDAGVLRLTFGGSAPAHLNATQTVCCMCAVYACAVWCFCVCDCLHANLSGNSCCMQSLPLCMRSVFDHAVFSLASSLHACLALAEVCPHIRQCPHNSCYSRTVAAVQYVSTPCASEHKHVIIIIRRQSGCTYVRSRTHPGCTTGVSSRFILNSYAR